MAGSDHYRSAFVNLAPIMKPAVLLKLARLVILLAITFSFCPIHAISQTEKPTNDEKARSIVQKAIQAMGGDRYLGVKTVIGRGFFTDYKDGVSGLPIRFADYIVYPDKERTEFIGGGARTVQTNDRDKGWIFDSAAITLKDQTAEQLADFRQTIRTSLENLLRGTWQAQGAKLTYVGRREAGVGRRNETVRLTYPDGFWIEYEFTATDGMPAKILYQRKHKKADTDEVEELAEEDRLYKPITIDGIVALYVNDHFVNGLQSSRTNYESVEFNKPIADSLFAKPASVKAVK
jgi:hypothetical protein